MKSPLLFFEVANDRQHVKPNSVNCLQVEPLLDNFIFYALPCTKPCTKKTLNENESKYDMYGIIEPDYKYKYTYNGYIS